jgi:hypothetical protein
MNVNPDLYIFPKQNIVTPFLIVVSPGKPNLIIKPQAGFLNLILNNDIVSNVQLHMKVLD